MLTAAGWPDRQGKVVSSEYLVVRRLKIFFVQYFLGLFPRKKEEAFFKNLEANFSPDIL